MRLRTILTAGALALSLATPALADISVLEGPAIGDLETVTFEDGISGFLLAGLVEPGAADVTFNGAESLIVDSQRIEAVAGTFNFLLFTLADAGLAFTLAEFNLNAAANGTTSIFAYDQFGTAFGGDFALLGAGSNIFSVAATNGQFIQSIVVMSTADLDDVGDIRLGGISAIVPEPAAWGMMILGFAGTGAAIRQRRRIAAV
jgi:hypothetical protein